LLQGHAPRRYDRTTSLPSPDLCDLLSRFFAEEPFPKRTALTVSNQRIGLEPQYGCTREPYYFQRSFQLTLMDL
jgi:hypothetical protein